MPPAATLPGQAARPALIAVAHGSRDPRSAATMAAVVAGVAGARPDLDIRLAFLDLNSPSVDQVVNILAAQGHSRAVVVPLLLGDAFHARVDLPGLLAAARRRHPRLHLTQADVLGPDPRLLGALADRVRETLRSEPVRADRCTRQLSPIASAPVPTGMDSNRAAMLPTPCGAVVPLYAPITTADPPYADGLGVAVAAVGSSSAEANGRTADIARRLAAETGWRTEVCFATTEPSVTQAISRLRARGATRIVVAPWFLAPGLLTDRLRAATPDHRHATAIGPHRALVEVICDRYTAAIDSLARTA
ncbi:sirohydrochlorin chelatase [Nocardia panacis]|uniref:Sirohydrochlorin chelatase n=1 Tax=Nocardia panacis TaxID=2340916 RepID=A0A3A4K634_9NOCA|nr:sirohydrochlorin chelatase [Nocardia panacis]RJO69910.1 sirohydrochlorin chelatase [Nocardia panacis]